MSNQTDSILDRVLATQINEEKLQFNPKVIVEKLLAELSERDRDIVVLRHGLVSNQRRLTLEDIGKKYNITRERVRQIEVTSVRQLKKIIKEQQEYEYALHVVDQIVRDNGGVIEEQEMLQKINEVIMERVSPNFTMFFLELIKDNFLPIKESKLLRNGWQLPDFNISILEEVIQAAEKLIKDIDRLLTLSEYWEEFRKLDVYERYQTILNRDVFAAYIHLAKRLKENPFGDWGMRQWNLITPKRMNDKIYLVLKHQEKPMHFRKITDTINEIKFDGKKAHPATVHNELILDHDRYVLVGRGIYALKEWGYKPGVVADVITEILAQSPEPLARQEIIRRVLEKRLVKESTIILALMNKKRFKKNGQGTYQINTES